MVKKDIKAPAFACECERVEFFHDGKDSYVGELELSNGKTVAMGITAYSNAQTHLEMYLPHVVQGKVGISMLERMASRPEAWCLWCDPSDGEVKLDCALESDRPEVADEVIDRMASLVVEIWDELGVWQRLSRSQSSADATAYDISSLIYEV